MTRRLLPAALLFWSTTAPAGGIPVWDAVAMTHALQELAAMAEQLTAVQAQLAETKRQVDALTGSRGLGGIANNPALRAALPPDAGALIDAAGALASRADSLLAEEAARPGGAAALARARQMAATREASGLRAYEAGTARLGQIDALMNAINTTTDPKGIAELQARIAVEQATVATEAHRLHAAALAQAAARDLALETRAARARALLGLGLKTMPSLGAPGGQP